MRAATKRARDAWAMVTAMRVAGDVEGDGDGDEGGGRRRGRRRQLCVYILPTLFRNTTGPPPFKPKVTDSLY